MRYKMKKYLTILTLLAFLCMYSMAWAAGSVCTQAITDVPETTSQAVTKVLTFTCTGDDSTGAFPSTALSAANFAKISGMYIIEVRTYPQTTNPTAAWDATIKDAGGFDLMGGTLANRSASAAESAVPAMITGIYGGRKVIDIFTFAATGNSVPSAGIITKVILER
jgi:hypothetical protein